MTVAKKVISGKNASLKIQNIVATTSLGKDVSLTKLARTQPNTEYNPEQFPGLVIRIRDPKTSALIFSSGKVVCTGARSMEKVEQSIEKIINATKSDIGVIAYPGIAEHDNQIQDDKGCNTSQLNDFQMATLTNRHNIDFGFKNSYFWSSCGSLLRIKCPRVNLSSPVKGIIVILSNPEVETLSGKFFR